MIASVTGRLAAATAERVVIETPGGVAYELTIPLGVMERLPPVGQTVTLATELVVREDGWSLYGFADDGARRFFQRLTSVSGVGPKLAIALLSHLGAGRGAKAIKEKNVALLASVSGIGKKTAERLALELGDKVDEFVSVAETGAPQGEPAAAALRALERLGFAPAEADRALRRAMTDDGGGAADTETLIRQALSILTRK